MTRQEPITLYPGTAGRLMVSDILPAILDSNDVTHELYRQVGMDVRDPTRYVRDFRTIRLDMGQRSGKNHAIERLAKSGDLVVAITDQIVRQVSVAEGVHRIGLQNFHMSSGFPVYNNIWLIDYNIWPRTSMKDLRNKLITSFDQRIIILG